MTEDPILDLLMRMYAIWPSALPPESRRKQVRNEWERLLAREKQELLNEALDRYATSPAGRYMPKPSELLQICDTIREERRQRNTLTPGRCYLCDGGGYALVQCAEESLFYSSYSGLGIKCPCRRQGEMGALRQGLKISRKTKSGLLTLWLENDRLTGELRLFERRPAGQEQQRCERSGQLQNAFAGIQDDLPF